MKSVRKEEMVEIAKDYLINPKAGGGRVHARALLLTFMRCTAIGHLRLSSQSSEPPSLQSEL